jgi:hypothetical protein
MRCLLHGAHGRIRGAVHVLPPLVPEEPDVAQWLAALLAVHAAIGQLTKELIHHP